MGLDCSHDAFHGAYSAFNRLRQMVAFVIGASFPPHFLYNEDGTVKYSSLDQVLKNTALSDEFIYYDDAMIVGDGIRKFLSHSDCDGEFTPEECIIVADELEKLLPKIDKLHQGVGHIIARGGYGDVLRKFIAGCRLAASKNEPLAFG